MTNEERFMDYINNTALEAELFTLWNEYANSDYGAEDEVLYDMDMDFNTQLAEIKPQRIALMIANSCYFSAYDKYFAYSLTDDVLESRDDLTELPWEWVWEALTGDFNTENETVEAIAMDERKEQK